MAEAKSFQLQCPTPLNDSERVQLAHGGGGRRMHELLEGLVLPSFKNDLMLERHDGATLNVAGGLTAQPGGPRPRLTQPPASLLHCRQGAATAGQERSERRCRTRRPSRPASAPAG